MEVRPRVVLVELSGMFDAPEPAVRDRLDRAGYEKVESTVAEERLQGSVNKTASYYLLSGTRRLLMRNF